MLRHPYIGLPAKFLSRITMGALWGIFLSPFALDVKLFFGALLAVLGIFLGQAFWAFDQQPVTAHRIALYGLLWAGEALAVGAIVFAALGAFTGQVAYVTLPMAACAFVGTLVPLAVMTTLYRDNARDNTARGGGSKT